MRMQMQMQVQVLMKKQMPVTRESMAHHASFGQELPHRSVLGSRLRTCLKGSISRVHVDSRGASCQHTVGTHFINLIGQQDNRTTGVR
mmetsp:Transcript_9251/g.13664  ORF Transcript_9251/g.13664 Transcript_9251/m.13664 type:complete len:88 (-) Transcript_9251:136-399(-)